MARDYLRQHKQALIDSGQLDLEAPEEPELGKDLTEKIFMRTAYNDESIKDYLPPKNEFNASVLPNPLSKLVGCHLDHQRMLCYTIDSDLMIRSWNLRSGRAQRSYLVETRPNEGQGKAHSKI